MLHVYSGVVGLIPHGKEFFLLRLGGGKRGASYSESLIENQDAAQMHAREHLGWILKAERSGLLTRALRSTVDFFINAQWEHYRLAVHPLVHRENCGDL
jgi:hypothetical protein